MSGVYATLRTEHRRTGRTEKQKEIYRVAEQRAREREKERGRLVE
jgi:hypothetical protein